ncbi:MAG: hypothetical protein WBP92_16905, partial [Candidatus Acidiferrales bacterium]
MRLPRSPFQPLRRFILFACLLPLSLEAQATQSLNQQPATAAIADPQAAPVTLPAAAPLAPAAANPPISITLSRGFIGPTGGKLPTSMTLEVFEENCDSSKGVPLAAVAPAASYALEIAGSGGISITGQKPGRCSIIASLKIDPNTPAGKEYVTLLDAAGAPVTSAELMVQSASAGAIPPGLEPEVDVLWEVMSQTDCADAFGTRLSASLYCIQLKIGNNTGFPIQLAGIGFANRLTDLAALGDPTVTFANNSYASTRAILLHQEMWAPRNVLYHSLEGAGLIMAGFTPFFVRPNAKTNFATATSIVSGPLLQAFGIVAPDPIISQLNNLDDQSFR